MRWKHRANVPTSKIFRPQSQSMTTYELYPASVKAPANSPCPLCYYEQCPLDKVLLEYVRLHERLIHCSIILLNPPIFPSLPWYGAQLPTVPAPFDSLPLTQSCSTREGRSAYFVELSINRSASSMWHGACKAIGHISPRQQQKIRRLAWSTYHPERIWLDVRTWWLRLQALRYYDPC